MNYGMFPFVYRKEHVIRKHGEKTRETREGEERGELRNKIMRPVPYVRQKGTCQESDVGREKKE